MSKLAKSSKNKMVSGVLGGIAEYVGMSATVVRVLFVLIMIATAVFPCVVGYIVAAMVLPKDTKVN
ncbi:membrane protein [Bacillus coahuilensis m2-6]|uniref:Membrane protein n=1 Tax=Bacillus coahuilensis p1.1.43 TaxID=1150625 RepID=A0A147KB29_9BACI|nr:PspC domain-containing protein [Bacillus coahuilensis]KUP08094.1 membrane protein [Bacillus coahuilensis p1.1.43]KUP09546.1 membrane protein [Bacillus coahuilensis m2-6]